MKSRPPAHRSAAFTLIELLVVISIIGLLAVVILASLSTARLKGKDASLEQEMKELQSQAEIYYTYNSSYVVSATPGVMGHDVCTTSQANKGILDLLTAVTAASGIKNGALLDAGNGTGGTAPGNQRVNGASYNDVVCFDSSTAWAASAPLSDSIGGTPDMWCVDSTGTSEQIPNNAALGNGHKNCP